MTTQIPVGTQEAPLLRTKLYIPPPRPELVPRPRLIERLNAGLRRSGLREGLGFGQSRGFGRKLTLISAPAGFGKTTLISEWVSHFGLGIVDSGLETTSASTVQNPQSAIRNRVAWFSLDESDNDLTRFLVYLVAALQILGIDIGKGALSALESPQPPPAETVLTSLINEVAVGDGSIILVLDDYHLIEAQSIHDALVFLLRRLPPQMHLAIATREDPPLPLARLRARGQLTELRATDLRFTPSEAAEFLNTVMGLNLSTEEIAELDRRTEGWVAGLQLAAISMQGRKDVAGFVQSFTGSHRFVLDYLVEEVLKQQAQEVQTFLLQTAILDRLTGPLCDAVTGHEDGQATLEMLDRANLFIVPLDDERRWYRYHHLFADLLRTRLRLEHAEKLPALYHRAAGWFEKNGDYPKAIDHLLSAEEYQRAAELMKLGANAIFDQQRSTQALNHKSMLRWLETLPVELMHGDPRLSILYTQSAWELGWRSSATLESHVQNAQRAYERLVAAGEISANDREYQTLPFEIYVGRAKSAIYTDNFALSADLVEKALAIAPNDNLPALVDAYVVLHQACRESGHLDKAQYACEQMISVSQPKGYHFGIMEGTLGLGFAFQLQGRLRRAAQAFQQVLQYAEERDLTWMRQVAIAYIKWSDVCYYRNDLAQSETFLLKALENCEQNGITLILNYGKIYLAQLRLAQGDDLAALETIQEVERAAGQNQIMAYDIEIHAHKALIQARLGDRDSAAVWLEVVDLKIDERLGFWQGIQGIQAAHVMVALDQIDRALDLLPRLEAAARTSGSLPYLIESLVIQAVLWHKKGETSKAEEALEEALVLAAPEGYVRVFLNEGKPMARLLYEALSRGTAPEYVRRLLAAFPVTEPEQTDSLKKQAPESDLIEPLSERELEVLQLIAEGLTNPEIASRLFLSLHTIKAHTHNIYGKLNVHSRTQAVVRSQELGLLPRRRG